MSSFEVLLHLFSPERDQPGQVRLAILGENFRRARDMPEEIPHTGTAEVWDTAAGDESNAPEKKERVKRMDKEVKTKERERETSEDHKSHWRY